MFKSIFPLAGAPKVYEPAEWETVKGKAPGRANWASRCGECDMTRVFC